MRAKTMLMAVVLAFAFALKAMAQNGPCKADLEKFCQGIQPGDGRLAACMKEHETELSDGCKAKGGEVKEKLAGLLKVCAADLEKFCKDVKPGEGRIIKCIKEHEAELSAGCKDRLAKDKKEMMKKNPCAADLEKFCKDVKPGEGRIIKCLKEHEKDLSQTCKDAQAEMKEKRREKKEEKREEPKPAEPK